MYPTNLTTNELTSEQLSVCHRTMDSTMLALVIIQRLQKRIPTSVIRESDGEQWIIQVGKNGADKPGFLRDEKWLKKYGVLGADLKHVAAELIRAGNSATYLGAPYAGLWRPKYNIYQHFPCRDLFISIFYHRDWAYSKLVGDVLSAGTPMVLHRDHEEVASVLGSKYNLGRVHSAKLGSWRDQASAEKAVAASDAGLILVSGGPTNKAFMVDLAERYNKVVLDVGNRMTKTWAPYAESIEKEG